MLRILKNLLVSPLSGREKRGFIADYYANNYWGTLLLPIFICFIMGGMAVLTRINPGRFGAGQHASFYLQMYLFLLVFTLLILLVAFVLRPVMNRRPSLFIGFSHLYGLVVCLWGGLHSAYTHQASKDIAIFLYPVLFVAIIVLMEPWQAILLYLTNLGVYLALLFHYIDPAVVTAFSSVIHSIVATVLSIVICSIMYRSRANAYKNRLIIMQQNEQINDINAQLRKMVLIDELTGTFNRRFLDEVLPEKLRQARADGLPAVAMMLDIDHFKRYNDFYGHLNGDHCLQTIVALARDCAPRKDSYLMRYGGEEFVMVAVGLDEEEACALAENIRRRVEKAGIEHKGAPLGHVTVSIGLCMATGAALSNADELITRADSAMYVAKNSGRNRVEKCTEALAG